MEASLIGPLGRTVLGSTKLTIGRAADNNLIVTDSRVSSHHAEIRPQGQYYSIVDLGSTNGTFVNEQQIYAHAPRPLQRGDTIRIGDTKFSFEVASSAQSGSLSSDGSTVRATPPPLSGAATNFGGNTSYGGGAVNYGSMQSSYGETIPAQPQPPSYTPSQPLQVSETQIPTYTPPLYRQPDQHPAYTPPPYTPPQANQPSYTPTPFQPPYTPQPPGAQPFYTPSQPPQSQKPGSTVRAIIFAVVAVVIILGGVGTFFVIHGQQVQQQNINATATAQSQANADASATAHVLATQNAVATATAQVTSHYPPFTNLALNDSLTSNSSSQWSSSSICQFTSAGYQVSIAQFGYYQGCLATGTHFSDFAYQITMTIQQGDCGGLVFRAVDPNNYRMFEICQDGTYNEAVVSNGTLAWASSQNSYSTAIHRGLKQANVLTIVVQGNAFNLYINGSGSPVAVFTSSTLSQGAIGVLADDQTNPTSVVYTHALVWTAS